jgi:hypothetical protein
VLASGRGAGLSKWHLRRLRGHSVGLNPDSDWTLWAYECPFDATSSRDPARLLESAPGEPMLTVNFSGGTAGILREQALPPLHERAGEEPPETLLTEDGA